MVLLWNKIKDTVVRKSLSDAKRNSFDDSLLQISITHTLFAETMTIMLAVYFYVCTLQTWPFFTRSLDWIQKYYGEVHHIRLLYLLSGTRHLSYRQSFPGTKETTYWNAVDDDICMCTSTHEMQVFGWITFWLYSTHMDLHCSSHVVLRFLFWTRHHPF